MGNAFAKSEIEVIKAQETKKKSCLGKYLNKHNSIFDYWEP